MVPKRDNRTHHAAASTVLIAPKKAVDWRVYVDYRKLNKITKPDACTLLDLEYEFSRIGKGLP